MCPHKKQIQGEEMKKYRVSPRIPVALHRRAKLYAVKKNTNLRDLVVLGAERAAEAEIDLNKYMPLSGKRVKSSMVFDDSEKVLIWSVSLQHPLSLTEGICACLMLGMGEEPCSR